MRTDASPRDDERTVATVVIVLAVILETVDVRFAGNLRLNVAIFGGISYFFILMRLRSMQRHLWVLGAWPLAALTLYVGWCLFSAFWAPTAAGSLQDSVMLALGLLLVVAAAEVRLQVFAECLVKVAVAVAVVSWPLALLAPQIAVYPDAVWRLNGVMAHPQRLVLLMGSALIMMVVMRSAGQRVFRTTRGELLVALLFVITLLATQTRANTVFLLAVMACILFAKARTWLKPFLLMFAAGCVWFVVSNVDTLLGGVERDGSNTATLTGRTTIWATTYDFIKDNPWVGYGYNSFTSGLTQNIFLNYVAPHAHNTWLNAAFETGIVGAALLTVYFVGVLALKPVGSTRHYVWPLMLFCILCGLTGVVYGGKIGTLWIIVAAMTAQALVESRSARSDPAYEAGRSSGGLSDGVRPFRDRPPAARTRAERMSR